MRALAKMNWPRSPGSILTVAALVLALAAVAGAGALALTGSSDEPVAAKRGSQGVSTAPRVVVSPPRPAPSEPAAPSDEPVARKSDDGDDSRSYVQEERCQPVDDMHDPEDGYIPSPEELLPDPEKCPEFFKGRPGAGGAAPPPVVGIPEPSPSPAPSQEPYRPCSETASLNGFPCWNTPSGPVYTDPNPLD